MRIPLTFLTVAFLAFSCRSHPESNPNQISRYTLAMVQMEVKGGKQGLNLVRAAHSIKEAAENGAAIVLLPEALDFGWTHSSARDSAGPIPGGRSFEALSRAARENDIYVCAGIVELEGENLYNAAVLLDRQGRLLVKHRKINELDFARRIYQLGNAMKVVDTELGRMGLLICADAVAQDLALAKSLGMMGADLILSPSAWAVPPGYNNTSDPYGTMWINAYRPISRMFNVWYVGVSNVGTIDDGEWKGWDCIGNSIAMDADGNLALTGPYGVSADTILYIEIYQH